MFRYMRQGRFGRLVADEHDQCGSIRVGGGHNSMVATDVVKRAAQSLRVARQLQRLQQTRTRRRRHWFGQLLNLESRLRLPGQGVDQLIGDLLAAGRPAVRLSLC